MGWDRFDVGNRSDPFPSLAMSDQEWQDNLEDKQLAPSWLFFLKYSFLFKKVTQLNISSFHGYVSFPSERWTFGEIQQQGEL